MAFASTTADEILFGSTPVEIPNSFSNMRHALQTVRSYHDSYAAEYTRAVQAVSSELSGDSKIIDPYTANSAKQVYRIITRLENARYRYNGARELLVTDFDKNMSALPVDIRSDAGSLIDSIRIYSSKTGDLYQPLRAMLYATAEWYQYVESRQKSIGYMDGQYVFVNPVDELRYHMFLKSIRQQLPAYLDSVNALGRDDAGGDVFARYIRTITKPLFDFKNMKIADDSYCNTGYAVVTGIESVDDYCSTGFRDRVGQFRSDDNVELLFARLQSKQDELIQLSQKTKTKSARQDYQKMNQLVSDMLGARYALDIETASVFARSNSGVRGPSKYVHAALFTIPEGEMKHYRYILAKQSAAIEFVNVLKEMISRDTSVEIRSSAKGYQVFVHRPIPQQPPKGSKRPPVDAYFKKYDYVLTRFWKDSSDNIVNILTIGAK